MRLGVNLVVGLAAVTLMAPVSTQANPETDATSASFEMTNSEAERFRKEVGLLHSARHIGLARLEGQLSAEFGLWLTADEQRVMEKRLEIQALLKEIRAYERRIESSGGLWISYPENATVEHALQVNLAVTSRSGDHEDAARKLVPSGADLVMHQARYSEEDLDSLHERIFADHAFFEGLGVELHSAFTIVPRNAVEIVLSNVNDAIEDAVLARYPDGSVYVVEGTAAQGDACSRSNCGPPWRGGLKIISPAGGCTAGYVARRYVGTWVYQLWTAGHCGTQTWRMGSSTGPVIGTTAENYFTSNSIDVQGITISSTAADDDYLNGSATCSSCTQVDIADDEPSGGDIIGAMVRNHGAYSGTKSGTLAATNGTITYLGETLTNLRRASYSRQPGDSGGPVIRISNAQYGTWNVAAGAHTHFQTISSTQWALYTHISYFSAWTDYALYTSGD